MTAYGLAARETAYGLIYDSLKNGCGKILSCGALVYKGLYIGLCEHTAAGGYRIYFLVILRVFVKSGGVGLDKGSHLVDERACSSGTYTVHALLHIAVFKVYYFGVLTAQLYRHIGDGSGMGECRRYRDDLLHKGDFQVISQSKPAGACYHGTDFAVARAFYCVAYQITKGLAYVGEMSLVIGKKQGLPIVYQSDLDRRGADIYTQSF